jgi:hypothetical protein
VCHSSHYEQIDFGFWLQLVRNANSPHTSATCVWRPEFVLSVITNRWCIECCASRRDRWCFHCAVVTFRSPEANAMTIEYVRFYLMDRSGDSFSCSFGAQIMKSIDRSTHHHSTSKPVDKRHTTSLEEVRDIYMPIGTRRFGCRTLESIVHLRSEVIVPCRNSRRISYQ